jgi:DNA-directed RNA polymerase specialized sigma24 family protein
MFDPATQYRPSTPAERRAAIAELRSRGLTARDIADVMRVELGEVLEALRDERKASRE